MGLEWASIINGVQYRFRVDTKVRKGKMTIYVNDFPIEVKRGLVSGLLGFDEQFVFDGIVARLIVHGRKKADVVINGLHLQSGLPYRKAPAWSWIFIILCVALIINGGALPVALGFLGAYACARVAKNSWNIVVRVLACVGITAGIWIVMLAIASALFYALH